MRPLILRSQLDLATEIKAEIGDPATGGLYGDAAIYRALRRAVLDWAGRVQFPRLYSFADGFTGGTWEYDVPRYVRGDIEVQIRLASTRSLGVAEAAESDLTRTWTTVYAGTLEPDSTSGESADFRFHTLPYTQEGRILWYARNGPIPVAATQVALSSTIAADATSLTINDDIEVGEVGWVKIEGEVIGYTDVTRGASTTTLLNLQRGLMGTTAAAHNSAVAVYWCVAADDYALWNQLLRQTMAYLHESRLHRGGVQDRRNHQEMVNHLQSAADSFWRINGYTPQRHPMTLLSQQAIGMTPWF